MVIRTVKPYRDKETKDVYATGTFREVSDQRGNELISGGYAVEYTQKETQGKIDKEQDKAIDNVLDLALKNGLIEKKGSWFSINGEHIGQGRDAAKQYLLGNPDLLKELQEKTTSAGNE